MARSLHALAADRDDAQSGAQIVDGGREDERGERIPAVCFIEDVARILKTSRRSIERRRRYGTFPIPELPAIDRRPRWSGVLVREFRDGRSGQRWRRSA